MTLNPIESFKTSLYSPKHTKNTKIHYHIYKKQSFPKSIFSKVLSCTKSAFYVFSNIIYIVEGHTA